MLQYYTCIQYTIIHIIHAKINLSTVKWAQWDKTKSRELLGLFIMCVCIALCTIIAHNIAQNIPDNFPSYPPVNHHCSNDVYLREGGALCSLKCIDTENSEAGSKTLHPTNPQRLSTGTGVGSTWGGTSSHLDKRLLDGSNNGSNNVGGSSLSQLT